LGTKSLNTVDNAPVLSIRAHIDRLLKRGKLKVWTGTVPATPIEEAVEQSRHYFRWPSWIPGSWLGRFWSRILITSSTGRRLKIPLVRSPMPTRWRRLSSRSPGSTRCRRIPRPSWRWVW